MATQQQQYPPMQYGRSRNPFGELTHSGYVPTYVGLPIDRMKETADKLETNYNTAIANKNKTEILLAQMNVDPEDEKLKTNALLGFEQELAGYKEKGNWEDAQIAVANSTKNIAVNSGLITALKSKKQKELQLAAFKAQVANGKALPKDLEFRKKQADALYKEQGGVYFDETTESWVGMWDAKDIPEVQNIGEKANKFLTNYKADTWIGLNKDAGYVKKVDPDTGEEKWYRASDLTIDEGIYTFKTSTEEVTLAEVSIAAHKQMLQDPFINERLEFTAKKDDFNIVTESERRGVPQNDTEWAMKNELIRVFGENPVITNRLSAEETALLWYKHVEIAKGIEASASKASYEKQIVDNVGFTKDQIEYQQRVKNAGSDKVYQVQQTAITTSTTGLTPAGNAATVTDHIKIIGDLNNNVRLQQNSVKEFQKQLDEATKNNQNTGDIVKKLNNAITARDKAMYEVNEYNKIYNQAVDQAEIKKGTSIIDPTPEIIRINDETEPKVVEQVDTFKKRFFNLWEKAYPSGKKTSLLGSMDVNRAWDMILSSYDKNMSAAKTNSLVTQLLDKTRSFGGAYTPAELDYNAQVEALADLELSLGITPAYRNSKGTFTRSAEQIKENRKLEEYVTKLNVVSNGVKADAKLISAELQNINDNKSYQVGVLDLRTTDKTGDINSTYQKQATDFIKTNWQHLGVYDGVTGQTENWADKKTGELGVNFNNLEMVGPTTDYMFNVGYGYKAIEILYQDDDPKNPEIGRKEIIIYENPTSSGGLKNLTMRYLQQGDLLEAVDDKLLQSKGTTKGRYPSNAYAAKIAHEAIDKQLAWFQNIPAVADPNKTVSREIQVSLTGDKKATVTRNIFPNSEITYDVQVWSYDPKTQKMVGKEPQWKTQKNNGYSSLNDVEAALEYYVGVKNHYKVPLSSLEKVASNTIPYTEFKQSLGSAQYLDGRMLTATKNLLKAVGPNLGGNIILTNLTRDFGTNAAVGGSKNSGHLVGQGVDIRSTDRAGKALVTWLEDNSEPISGNSNYRKVKGYPLQYWVHNVKSANNNFAGGDHIDLKLYTK